MPASPLYTLQLLHLHSLTDRMSRAWYVDL
jgi:hypothetical protein